MTWLGLMEDRSRSNFSEVRAQDVNISELQKNILDMLYASKMLLFGLMDINTSEEMKTNF